MTAWDDALDAFEVRLAVQRTALDAGAPTAPFAPPPELGPCPQRLQQRAADLLQEATELQAEIEMALNSITREMAMVRRLAAAHAEPVLARLVDRGL